MTDGASMSFDDSGPSSSQTLLRYFPSVQRSPENQSEECNRPDAGSEPHVHSTPKDFYRKTYFEFADAIKGELTRRFDQENYKLYMRAEQLLIHAAGTGEVLTEHFKQVCDHFGDDLDYTRLRKSTFSH